MTYRANFVYGFVNKWVSEMKSQGRGGREGERHQCTEDCGIINTDRVHGICVSGVIHLYGYILAVGHPGNLAPLERCAHSNQARLPTLHMLEAIIFLVWRQPNQENLWRNRWGDIPGEGGKGKDDWYRMLHNHNHIQGARVWLEIPERHIIHIDCTHALWLGNMLSYCANLWPNV